MIESGTAMSGMETVPRNRPVIAPQAAEPVNRRRSLSAPAAHSKVAASTSAITSDAATSPRWKYDGAQPWLATTTSATNARQSAAHTT